MRRFEFALESVLRVKQQLERLAELRQQQARAVVQKAQARVQTLQQELARLADLLEAPAESVAVLSPLARCQQTTQLCTLLERAEAEVRTAAQQLAEADRRRVQASLEVEALLTLRRQQWEEYREAQLRAGQRELDELGLWRWLEAARERGNKDDPV